MRSFLICPKLGRISLSGKVGRPADGGEPIRAGNDYIVRAAGTVDNEQVPVCIPAAHDAHMAVAGIEYKVAGLCCAP